MESFVRVQPPRFTPNFIGSLSCAGMHREFSRALPLVTPSRSKSRVGSNGMVCDSHVRANLPHLLKWCGFAYVP
jgi:hypothetical protein